MTYQTAIHESGHVVAAHVAGATPTSVVVFWPGRGLTRGHGAADGDPEAEMVGLLAGRAAEVVMGFDPLGADEIHDERRARGIALRVAGFPARMDDVTLAAADAMFTHAEERARQLVTTHRDVVGSFATSLVSNGGRLGGHEVSDALRLAFWRPAAAGEADVLTEADYRNIYGRGWDRSLLLALHARVRANLLRAGRPTPEGPLLRFLGSR